MLKKQILPYISLFLSLSVLHLAGQGAHEIFSFFEKSADAHLIMIFFEIAVICTFSFLIFYIANGTFLPSFVLAIFFGIAGKNFFENIVETEVALSTLVAFGATLILFSGGLETTWNNFRKLIYKIMSLSFLGMIITSWLFSIILYKLVGYIGINVSMEACIILGAVLASTDPASIVPILKQLRFKNKDTKDIIVSESAMTDVAGTLLSIAFITLFQKGLSFDFVTDWYLALFSKEVGIFLLKQLFYGFLFGIVGYIFLEGFLRFKKKHDQEFEVDAAYFFFVPVLMFTIAVALGGSGYLAAFIAGLIFNLTEHIEQTEKFFYQTIEAFLKPIIFILLGALVDVNALLDYALIGIAISFLFMFIVRPIAAFISLYIFTIFGKDKMSIKDLLFISFVRETGAIPAVLLITIASSGLDRMDGVVAIGMWVILITLIVEPVLTSKVATLLGVAEQIKDEKKVSLTTIKPFILLGSRGKSFLSRLDFVVDWASERNIYNIVLVHCLEDKYSKDTEDTISNLATLKFDRIKLERELKGLATIEFTLISRKGFLQKNIKYIIDKYNNLIAVFVGRKILDFRFSEIKSMNVPIFFLD